MRHARTEDEYPDEGLPEEEKHPFGVVKQELHCHACDRYVQFELDMDVNGNHVLECPNCKHEHCRVVYNGEITGDRWDRRNGVRTYRVSPSYTTSSTTSTYTTYVNGGQTTGGTTDTFLYSSWSNTTTTS
jgi:hypothetical protein